MALIDRDAKLNQITKQMEQKQNMILKKVDELKKSKKENPLLEEVYSDYANYVKQTKKDVVNAFKGLHEYISSLEVKKEEQKEKLRDLYEIKKELRKIK